MAGVPSAGDSQRKGTPPGDGVPSSGLGGPVAPEDDWDQEASLAAFVAEVEAGRAHGLIDPDDFYDPNDCYVLPGDGPLPGEGGLPGDGPLPEDGVLPEGALPGGGVDVIPPGSAWAGQDQAAADSAAGRPEPDAGLLPWGMDGGRADGGCDRGGGSGFGSGGMWDKALPGPALAGAADAAAGAGRGYAGASDDELIGVLGGWQRIEAWAAAGRWSAVAELVRRRPGTHGDRATCAGIPASWGKFCADEVAVALSISRWAADKTTAVARDLATRLPLTNRALAEGVIDAYKAQVIAEATRVLDDAAAAQAEAVVFACGVAGKTPGQIRVLIARAVLKADPAGARKRREQAQRDARVELWREDAGTAAICGFGLPPDAALAADQQITTRATELKAAGVPGTADQLRVRAYLDALLGQDTAARYQATPGSDRPGHNDGSPGSKSPHGGEGPHDGKSPHGGEGTAGGEGPHGREGLHGREGTAGGGDTPAGGGSRAGGRPHDGSGPAGDGEAAGPASGPTEDEGPASGFPEDGGPASGPSEAGGPASEPPEAGQGSGRGENGEAGYPVGAGRPAARINLTIPLATLLGLAEHPGEAAGFGPLDPALARDLAGRAAGNPRTTWCVTVTGPADHPVAHGCAKPGQRRRKPFARTRPARPGTRPPGDNRPPPGPTGPPGPGTGPPGPGPGHPPPGTTGPPGGYGTWQLQLPNFSGTGRPGPPGRATLAALTVDLEPIPVSDCDHRHQTPSHDPSNHLRHLVEIRDGECDWPPCRRAAQRCDFEHTIPWQDGGLTCACNAGPRCRHHHHQKQHPRWRLTQTQPGTRTWTTPAGRTYTSGPITYPT